MESKGFVDIRNDYINARTKERKSLVDLLEKNGYKVLTGSKAGQGNTNYSGGGKLKPPYDLRNHKWIDAKKGEVKFLISLNPYEIDTGSANPHHLYDRIGVQAYLGDNTETDIRTAMIITKWSLPVTEDEGNSFISFLKKLYEMLETWLK